jgi:tRNA-splicing ligase RtcB (3'-phosphate/5'-hydroxy nucleic acid ligase)
MHELQGKYNTAKVFTDNVEESAINQILELCSQEFTKDSIIRIMPDTHAGAGCTIGTTMTILDKVVPNLVGVDIGCGMFVVELGTTTLDLPAIDKFIKENIPSGFNINPKPIVEIVNDHLLKCLPNLHKSAFEFDRAVGSLGGGNHFIEIDVDEQGNKYLVVHSGSRNMGLQVAKYYQDQAVEYQQHRPNYKEAMLKLISEHEANGTRDKIQEDIKKLKIEYQKDPAFNKNLAYLEGDLMLDYLHDMEFAQAYASANRSRMAQKIVEFIGLDFYSANKFETIHNYIDLKNMILRKGAISARKDEIVIIPINMRDGSLICKGKGNPDWNYSAPHGAGRLMSRNKAKASVSIKEFQDSMVGIYTTTANRDTLDESPMAYKPMQEIIDNIQDTVEVLKIIKPIYNFKAGGD